MKNFINAICFSLMLIPTEASAIIDIIGIGHNSGIESSPGVFDCTGGYIDVLAEGNAGPFVFAWSNGETTEDIQYLCSGMYTVTVTNAFGCTKVLSATIHDCTYYPATPYDIEIFWEIVTPLSAPNASDGAINISTDGGYKLYYKWTKQGSNQVLAATQDISGLSAGTYCVEITGGCEPESPGATACYTITDCGSVSWNVNSVVKNACDCTGCWFCDSPCRGGSITSNITSPSGPKKYKWSNGATATSLNDLSAGNYSVTLTDVNTGCTATRSFDIVTKPVVVEKVSGCAWEALCDGEQIKFYAAETDKIYSIQEYMGETRCMFQYYCDGVPTSPLTPGGYPEKIYDWDFCKGKLVCKNGIDDEVFSTVFGEEEVLEAGQDCQDRVKCTITWPDGTTSSHISEDGSTNWTYCHQIISGGIDPACNSYCVTYRYCEDLGIESAVQVDEVCYFVQLPEADECLALDVCPFEPPPYLSPSGSRSQQLETNRNLYWSISPNPFKDHLYITFEHLPKETTLGITIFDLVGKQLVHEAQTVAEATGTITLNVNNHLPPGSYSILVESKECSVSYRTMLIKI